MPDDAPDSPMEVYLRWLRNLASRDPALHEDLMRRMQARKKEVQEGMASATGPLDGISLEAPDDEDVDQFVAETIVREGRPALLVQRDAIAFNGTEADSSSKPIIDRLKAATSIIEPLLPLVGRIDVANYPGNMPFLGTGWLVEPGIVVTNRHVAELMVRADGQQFVFRPGRFGEKLQVSMDYRREHAIAGTAVAQIKRVIWIEPDSKKADIAFLEVGTANDNIQRGHVDLALKDAVDTDPVAVIGYPARAPSHIIPNQAWMERIYGGTYDIKRVAPGLMGPTSRGWATHDCTTLGGNSGSVVVNMNTGKAVALHFAGLYMVENYAVPASAIREYLNDKPWMPRSAPATRPESATPVAPVETKELKQTLSLNIPVRIDVSLGSIEVRDGDMRISTTVNATSTSVSDLDSAATALARSLASESGVLAVRPGGLLSAGRLTSDVGLVVAAHPDRLEALGPKIPNKYRGFSVVLQPGSIQDQLGIALDGLETEAVSSIAYNDDDRTGPEFALTWLNEDMSVTAHVGPERGWSVLKGFIGSAKTSLVSSIYEFHAGHIASAIRDRLDDGLEMKLVLARQSRNPSTGKIPEGDFDRAAEFERWREEHPKTFHNVYVPIGTAGLVANSYHIKVTVRDEDDVWLSSGNWKRASQPLIPEEDLNDPRKTSSAGNREWHVTLTNSSLAERFRSHITEDFRYCQDDLGGTTEAVGDEVLVDVPRTSLEAVEPEGPAERVFEPLVIPQRRIRVKPLLTPDKRGTVFTDAVLAVIESAKSQLVFQNQYIKFANVKKGNLKVLVDALCSKSKTIEDFRIILRSGGDGFLDDMRALQLNGLDVNRCVRRLANTHTKGIVVDGKKLLIGSHNWSSDGVSLNRDASLIFDDRQIAQYFLEVFEVDWKRASELQLEETVPEAAPRIAVGDGPPEGFVRMPLSEYLDR
ncbi:phospholipase D-like domain-containing protein [Methylibium petroleiphilum]|uniref:phospholipase D-like domain-containing protein n=1 Tax=Methylibium petroleiphilum TaxID=105560 RepID=UPI003D2923D9